MGCRYSRLHLNFLAKYLIPLAVPGPLRFLNLGEGVLGMPGEMQDHKSSFHFILLAHWTSRFTDGNMETPTKRGQSWVPQCMRPIAVAGCAVSRLEPGVGRRVSSRELWA